MTKPLHLNWPLVLLLSASAAGISAFALPGTLLCLVVILWFLLVCPGMTLVRYLDLKEPHTEWTLAIAVSLAIDALVASIALYAGAWFPPGILGILITFCIFGVIGQFTLTRRASFLQAGFSGGKFGNLAAVFLLLVLIALLAGLGIWSYRMRTHEATTTSASFLHATTSLSPSAPSPGVPSIDAVIVMDNVDLITHYDPQGDRFKAAQLFASMLPLGSELGIVRITSTSGPVRMLDLQALHTSSGRTLAMNTLTAHTFGPADRTPVAYFEPALEMAGNMLHARPASDRKLILIITDALALSGDQNACASSSDAYHNWFCTVAVLTQQEITVALVGFTPPENTTMLQPVQQFFAAHGGDTVPVTDGPNLAARLTMTYRAMLSETDHTASG